MMLHMFLLTSDPIMSQEISLQNREENVIAEVFFHSQICVRTAISVVTVVIRLKAALQIATLCVLLVLCTRTLE
jgi:hypothetical protein